jgi:hypothetical protein
MARREYRTTFHCAEPGCREAQWLVHDLRRDQQAACDWQREHPFRCSRHRKPEQNLRPGNGRTTYVLVASRLHDLPSLFWVPEDGTTGSGYSYGPGFTAHADDFPEGTRLVVTTEIQSPATAAA